MYIILQDQITCIGDFMAQRPIFIPNFDSVGVHEKLIEFKWHPGMSKTQKQKSISGLHQSAERLGYGKVLEISSKSQLELGVSLSAFNLKICTQKYKREFSVECAFQGSKVFENGGPYKDLFDLDSRAAKKDMRIKNSGDLIRFEFFNIKFPLLPRTYFYDWLYINALNQNVDLKDKVLEFDGFSDIEFNPAKSINCQAHSAALYVSLNKSGKLEQALSSPDIFLGLAGYQADSQNNKIQSSLL